MASSPTPDLWSDLTERLQAGIYFHVEDCLCQPCRMYRWDHP